MLVCGGCIPNPPLHPSLQNAIDISLGWLEKTQKLVIHFAIYTGTCIYFVNLNIKSLSIKHGQMLFTWLDHIAEWTGFTGENIGFSLSAQSCVQIFGVQRLEKKGI